MIKIIGAGPAGLSAALVLLKSGHEVEVFEKRHYPCVKLCGEFMSHEGLQALARVTGISVSNLVGELKANELTRFSWFSRRGNQLSLSLFPSGMGVRRDVLDPWMAQAVINAGGKIYFGTRVNEEEFAADKSRVVLWATGKEIPKNKTKYFAVKGYCASSFHFSDDVALFQLQGGYIGFSRLADGELSYCALFDRELVDSHWRYSNWEQLCEGAFQTNLRLRRQCDLMTSVMPSHVGSALFDFTSRAPVRNGRWYVGDAVQLIPPFVGDGMSMAIESGELAAQAVVQGLSSSQYTSAWTSAFKSRLRTAQLVHPLLWNDRFHEPILTVLKKAPWLSSWIYQFTRGAAKPRDGGPNAFQKVS